MAVYGTANAQTGSLGWLRTNGSNAQYTNVLGRYSSGAGLRSAEAREAVTAK